jgi:hypothetical protein
VTFDSIAIQKRIVPRNGVFCTRERPIASVQGEDGAADCASVNLWAQVSVGTCRPTAGTCGVGTQTAVYECQDTGGNRVNPSDCDGAPPTAITACAIPCPNDGVCGPASSPLPVAAPPTVGLCAD